MRKIILLVLVGMFLLPIVNSNLIYGSKAQMIEAIPLDHIIDLYDSSYSEYYYALQEGGTIWIGSGSGPALRGPRIEGATKIAGNLVLTAKGEVWTWSVEDTEKPKRITELYDIKDISAGPAFMALNEKGQVYIWGSPCYVAIMRSDFQNNRGVSCSAPTQADLDLASIPKIAVENVSEIRASMQSLMVLMKDKKTVNWYGNTYIMDMGMYSVVSPTAVKDFAAIDSDVTSNSEVKVLPETGFLSELPNQHFHKLSVSYENFYSLYLNQDGTVWGKSDWVGGSPKQIQPLKNMTKINAIALNSGTALDKNGMIWTWGNRRNLPYSVKPDHFMSKVDAKPATRQISLKVNDNYIKAEPGPIQVNGVTLVPLRALFESIGAQVNYENDKIIVTYADQRLEMQVYDVNVTLNGKKHKMNAAITSYRGKTYVPVRFISEALGAKVQWDALDGCVVIKL
ncbi:stalk domain-containing protein [Paenibacillus luteus]|uniref:stalk domain-containing protein n=1 Tax=Paenibacillus luteus TaxID=2545753 RepID=UPI001142A3D1|nr:copper amine oxidase N-terminal domain-containing protein [Paenibacillus luteus]